MKRILISAPPMNLSTASRSANPPETGAFAAAKGPLVKSISIILGLIVAAGLVLAVGCQCCGTGGWCDAGGCGLFAPAPSDCGPTAPPPAVP